jgi:8-oxo-dGTP pyrophosphatase MutT (NUDIX family)
MTGGRTTEDSGRTTPRLRLSTSVVRPLEGASVVVVTRDGVLMVERGSGVFAGRWSFPGGKSEPGEEAETTARRELFEEARITVGPMVRLGAFEPAPEVMPLRLTVFAARSDGRRVTAGDDALRAAYVPFHAVLTRPTTPGAPGWIVRAVLALADPPLI